MSVLRTLDYDWTYDVLDLWWDVLLTVCILFCSIALCLPVHPCSSVTWVVVPALWVFSVSTCVSLVPQPIPELISFLFTCVPWSPGYLSPVFALSSCWSVDLCKVSSVCTWCSVTTLICALNTLSWTLLPDCLFFGPGPWLVLTPTATTPTRAV